MMHKKGVDHQSAVSNSYEQCMAVPTNNNWLTDLTNLLYSVRKASGACQKNSGVSRTDDRRFTALF